VVFVTDNIGLTAGPAISTNVEAHSLNEISFAWKIVAVCHRRDMIWRWFMDGTEFVKIRPAVDDGSIIMVQRRDAEATVLLAKWAKMA
jgi:hypothetical protein